MKSYHGKITASAYVVTVLGDNRPPRRLSETLDDIGLNYSTQFQWAIGTGKLSMGMCQLSLAMLMDYLTDGRFAKRKIGLTGAAVRVVAQRLKTCSGPYIFPHADDPNRPIPKINNAHDRAVERSGVQTFRLYDLRHTFATRAAAAGIDLVTLAAMLGHARIQMVLRYAHPTDEHKLQAVKRLEQFNATKQIEEATLDAAHRLQ